MATDVSIRLGVDGEKEFRTALNGINSQIKSLNSEMKSVVSGFTDMDNAETRVAKQTDVLGRAINATKQKIKTISAEYDRQKAKLNELGAALDEASSAEYSSTAERERAITKATNAYNRQANAVNKLSSDLNAANADLNRMEKEMRDLESGADKAGDAMDDLGSDAKGAGSSLREAFAGGAVAGAIQSLISGITGLVDQTKEYQKIMGTLEVSSQKAGYTADQTAASYQQLYGVIGDDQQSATALANLQALGVSQDQLTMFIDGAIGAWATYGDSIPIDSLAEAINETAQAGVVTGTFADVLNWAGTSEDGFNEKLAACSTESERANLILQELQNQGLMGAAAAWRENNEVLYESQIAQQQLNDTMAQISELIMPIVTLATTGINAILEGLLSLVSAFQEGGIAGLFEQLNMMITSFAENMQTNGPVLMQAGMQIITNIVMGIAQGLPLLMTSLGQLLNSFVLFLTENTPMLLEQGTLMINSLVNGIFAALPGLLEQAGLLVTSFIEYLGTAIPALFEAGGEIILNIANGIVENLPELLSRLPEIIDSIMQTLSENIPKIVQSGVELIQKLGQGIIDALPELASHAPEIVSALAQAIIALNSGLFDAGVTLIQALAQGILSLLGSIRDAGQQAFNAIRDRLTPLASTLQNMGRNAMNSFANGLRSLLGTITTVMTTVANNIKNKVQELPGQLLSIGRNIISGLVDGIKSGVDRVTGAIGDVVNRAISKAESLLGINSPSKVFRYRIGAMIGAGMALGIESSTDQVLKAANKLNDELLKEEKKLNKQLEEMELKAIQEEEAAKLAEHEKAIQEKYAELAEAEEDGKQKILDEIAKLEDDWNAEQLEKQKEAEKEKLEAQIKTLEDFKKEYQSALDEIEKSQESMAKKLKDYGDLFETVKTETGSFLELGDLEEDINAIQRYGDALEQLKARGVSDSLMDEIVGMSVDDATAYTEQLLSMTDDQYTEYMALWEKKQIEAQQIAKKFYSDEMDALQDEFVNKIPEELGGVKDEMRSIGVDGIQGMIDGMYSRSGALWSAASSIVAQAIAAMRMAADINSPSRKVAKMVGVPMGEGVAVGMMQGIKDSRAAIDAAIMQPISRISTDDMYNAAAATVNGMAATSATMGTQTIIIPVNLNGKQIAEVVFDPLRQIGKQRGVALG